MIPKTLHAWLGAAVFILPLVILVIKNKRHQKFLGLITVVASWLSLFPAAQAYLGYYQVAKKGIKAGSTPWAHSIFMETKEHWGILIPILATTSFLALLSKNKDSKNWWLLTSVVALLIYIMGKFIRSAMVAA